MANNVIPVSDLRKWCRFKASRKPDRGKLIAQLNRTAKLGVQQEFDGWLGTPENGQQSSADLRDAVNVGAKISRLSQMIAKGEPVDLDGKPIEYRPGVLENLPAAGLPHEVPVKRRFETDGRSFVLSGRLDAVAKDGIGWEYKTAKKWKSKIKRIDRSYQWRCYLWAMPELTAVHYRLFRVKHMPDRTLVVDRYDAPVKPRYAELEQDVTQELQEFISWVDRNVPAYWD